MRKMRLKLNQIQTIQKKPDGKGYEIIFNDGRTIYIHKKRTIPALLTLIRFGEGCEGDLTRSSNNLQEIKEVLKGKIPDNLILDSYSDANKPFSELWNEEGFTFITNPPGQTRNGSKKYVLKDADHEKLFSAAKKAERKPPPANIQAKILKEQNSRCNFCDSILKTASEIAESCFSRDRVRIVWDHRIPVEKGGSSDNLNYQALCFYCNKCKWQICNMCDLDPSGCKKCALAYPEETMRIAPTEEDISDRAAHHG